MSAFPETNVPAVSVAICTHNPTPEFLRRVLLSIGRQHAIRGGFELFVIDNNSRPAVTSLDVVAELGIEVLVEPQPGLTAARRCALQRASGRIVVFVDDDNVLEQTYLREVVAIFDEEPSVAVLSGRILPEYVTAPPAWITTFEANLAIRRLPDDKVYSSNAPLLSEYFPIGAGMAVDRQILEQYFVEQSSSDLIDGRNGSTLTACEDYDIGFFAISRGRRVAVSGRLELHHIIPPVRLTARYLARLVAGSNLSLTQLGAKWLRRQGWQVAAAPFQSRARLFAKCALLAAAAWHPAFRIRFMSNVALLRIAMSRPAPARS